MLKVLGRFLAQGQQHGVGAQTLGEALQRRRAARELLRQPGDDDQPRQHLPVPALDPLRDRGRLYGRIRILHFIRRPNDIGHRLQRPTLFHRRRRLLGRLQGPRHARRQAVGQQAERHVPHLAVVPGDEARYRVQPLVGAVAREPAPAFRVRRAALQSCLEPRLLCYVLLEGQVTRESYVHPPGPEPVPAAAGLLPFRHPRGDHPRGNASVPSRDRRGQLPGLRAYAPRHTDSSHFGASDRHVISAPATLKRLSR